MYAIFDQTADRLAFWSRATGVDLQIGIDFLLFSQVQSWLQVVIGCSVADRVFLINADAYYVRSDVEWTGVRVALRLREEPNRFPVPIILCSHEPRWVAETLDMKVGGTALLSRLLEDDWQAIWMRLPIDGERLGRAAAELRRRFDATCSAEVGASHESPA